VVCTVASIDDDLALGLGDDLDTDDNVVFHGPLTVGDRLTMQDDAVLFARRSACRQGGWRVRV